MPSATAPTTDRNESTKETAPWHIWHHEVTVAVKATVHEIDAAVGRARLLKMYGAGEPVWMAASAVQAFVDGARRAAREDREANGLRDLIRQATGREDRQPQAEDVCDHGRLIADFCPACDGESRADAVFDAGREGGAL